MSLPPILYHCFRHPLPYARSLALQERLHQVQLQHRKTSDHSDVLLLLEHRPVYTAGRRQTESSVETERIRLNSIGADFAPTLRGGQTTYHGPGQIVGYPLLDLSRRTPTMGVREYVDRMQDMLESYLLEFHGIKTHPSEHTGVFLNADTKIGSIGVQVRHRLTSHGFAINITKEPLAWMNQIVACGLVDVRAGCLQQAVSNDAITVEGEIPFLVRSFSRAFDRELVPLKADEEGEVQDAIRAMEEESRRMGEWHMAPAAA